MTKTPPTIGAAARTFGAEAWGAVLQQAVQREADPGDHDRSEERKPRRDLFRARLDAERRADGERSADQIGVAGTALPSWPPRRCGLHRR